MKYIFNYTDNNGAASRGSEKDTYYEEEYEFKNDREALLKVLEIQGQSEDDNFNYYSDEELNDYANEIDVGFGAPVVFYVENEKGEKIFDSGIDIDEWKASQSDDENYGEDDYEDTDEDFEEYDDILLKKKLAEQEDEE